MKESDEPSKRMPLSGNAGREVQIQKIRLRHIAEHFQFLLDPRYRQLRSYLERYRLRLAELLKIYAAHANKFRGVQIHSVEQLRPNLGAVVALLLVVAVFTHYAIATAAGTTPLNSFLLKDDTAGPVETENPEEETDEIEYVNEPIKTARTVNATAYSVTNVPPKQKETVVTKRVWVPITAYSSTPDQTDGSPFITASGTRVRDGIVAANFLPIGTTIRIPEYYGDKVFVVEDRMNSRYWEKVDIWMPTRAAALNFGLRRTYVEVVKIN